MILAFGSGAKDIEMLSDLAENHREPPPEPTCGAALVPTWVPLLSKNSYIRCTFPFIKMLFAFFNVIQIESKCFYFSSLLKKPTII